MKLNESISSKENKINDPLLAPPDVFKLISNNFCNDSFMPMMYSSEESVKLNLA